MPVSAPLLSGPDRTTVRSREIRLLIEDGRLTGYAYRGWVVSGPHVATWLTRSQRYQLKRRGYLGPTLERRYRELFATALDFAVARMGNHERLRFEPATQVPDEAAPEHTT